MSEAGIKVEILEIQLEIQPGLVKFAIECLPDSGANS